jgi:Suppressor of fused protein (SUFU)
MGIFDRLFRKNVPEEPARTEFTEAELNALQEAKESALEDLLGKPHTSVMHAIIPFAVGGAVDMYMFPHHLPGVGFATMELIDPAGKGPKPNEHGTFELVAFTRLLLHEELDQADHPFTKIMFRLRGIFTTIGFYATDALLRPGDTCEVPVDGEDNRCLVFDLYEPAGKSFHIGSFKSHLLLCMEVFRSEMEFARSNGSASLLQKLKEAGHYPYSDLDRKAVV